MKNQKRLTDEELLKLCRQFAEGQKHEKDPVFKRCRNELPRQNNDIPLLSAICAIAIAIIAVTVLYKLHGGA